MKHLISSFIIFCFLVSCSGDSVTDDEKIPKPINQEEEQEEDKVFSKENMLIYWADNIIIPGYEDLVLTSGQLNDAITKFTDSPSSNSLKKARESWEKAYEVWQKVSIFQIGKAATIEGGLTRRLNSYPTNTNSILKHIEEANYNFSSGKMKTSEGFPALDYLLNAPKGSETDEEIISLYSNNENFATYLKHVSKDINDLATVVSEDWKNRYRAKFIKKFGTGRRSNVTKVINYFIKTFLKYELIEKKIANPSAANYAHMYPEKVEAYYKKNISKKLYLTAFNTVINFFEGKSYDGKKTGFSIEQYLIFLNKKELVDQIKDKFNTVIEANKDIEDNMYKQIMHPDKKDYISTYAYNALNKLFRVFELDMLTAIGLSDGMPVTDTDND